MSADQTIDYEGLAQDAMRGLVRTILKRVHKHGLPGDHHFYIAFYTRAPGVSVSDRLKEKYPEEMTIVMQHRFWGLQVFDDKFEIKLTFDSIPERLVVPYRAIKVFFDPSVPYGLQFEEGDGKSEIPANELDASERGIGGLAIVPETTAGTHAGLHNFDSIDRAGTKPAMGKAPPASKRPRRKPRVKIEDESNVEIIETAPQPQNTNRPETHVDAHSSDNDIIPLNEPPASMPMPMPADDTSDPTVAPAQKKGALSAKLPGNLTPGLESETTAPGKTDDDETALETGDEQEPRENASAKVVSLDAFRKK